MNTASYLILLLFALLPGSIWLVFFLIRDKHPEPKKKVLEILFWGGAITLPAIAIELIIYRLFDSLNSFFAPYLFLLITALIIAFVEEFLKYLVIKEKVINTKELDEPIDAMMYMVTAAMGFAAIENILILFSLVPHFILKDAAFLSILRFVGATFLHALASAYIGYFLALSFFETKRRKILIFLGIFISTFLHALYNFSIMIEKEWIGFSVIVILALVVSFLIENIKEIASICLPGFTSKTKNNNHFVNFNKTKKQ